MVIEVMTEFLIHQAAVLLSYHLFDCQLLTLCIYKVEETHVSC